MVPIGARNETTDGLAPEGMGSGMSTGAMEDVGKVSGEMPASVPNVITNWICAGPTLRSQTISSVLRLDPGPRPGGELEMNPLR